MEDILETKKESDGKRQALSAVRHLRNPHDQSDQLMTGVIMKPGVVSRG